MANLKALIPRFDRKLARWVIDVPKALNEGKRKRMFFKEAADANKAHAELVFSLAHTGAIPSKAQAGDTSAHFVAAFLAKKSVEVEKETLRQLKWGLLKFSEAHGTKRPQDLQAVAMRRWVDKLPLTTRGRFNVFAVCRDFFSSPAMRAIVRENPFSDAPPKKDKGARLRILTVPEMRALLDHEWPDWFKSWLVAGAFGGLRTREIFAVNNSALDWEYDEIVIRKEDAKQGEAARPRSATIYAPMKRHMPRRGADKALVHGWSKKRWKPIIREACRLIGVEPSASPSGAMTLKWPDNCLRHSFASYHLAHYKDATNTAFLMGTSPRLLYETYANQVSRRDAAKWWEL
jgi:integrase